MRDETSKYAQDAGLMRMPREASCSLQTRARCGSGCDADAVRGLLQPPNPYKTRVMPREASCSLPKHAMRVRCGRRARPLAASQSMRCGCDADAVRGRGLLQPPKACDAGAMRAASARLECAQLLKHVLVASLYCHSSCIWQVLA